MVEVVSKTNVVQNASPSNIIGFFVSNGPIILFALVIVILAIVVFFFIKKMQDERKERDPFYQVFKNQKFDCIKNRDDNKIKKTYSPINILFLGLPILKQENSAKVVDYSNKLIGYYRGGSYTMDGFRNFVLYKKKFFFMEDLFVLKCPYTMKVKVYKRDRDGNKILDKYQKPITQIQEVDYSYLIQDLRNGDVKINCSNIQKDGFFYYPVYLSKENNIIDYRTQIKKEIVDNTYSEIVNNILSTGSQMVESAMEHNPNMKYNQKVQIKNKEEDVE